MKTLVYTFRTFPDIFTLEEIFGEVFVFGSLKKDLQEFLKIIESVKPDLILGIAKSEGCSRVELVAINQFGKTKKIEKDGPKSLELIIPEVDIKMAQTTTASFCNWTAYKLALKTNRVAFIHINENDLNILSALV